MTYREPNTASVPVAVGGGRETFGDLGVSAIRVAGEAEEGFHRSSGRWIHDSVACGRGKGEERERFRAFEENLVDGELKIHKSVLNLCVHCEVESEL